MKVHLPRRRIWRVAIYAGSLLLVLIAADMVLARTRRRIHPGFDTTRIVAPLQPDGSIDYLIAVDNRSGEGVTPENNAAVPLLEALGRQALATYNPVDGVTDRLGMPHLPDQGDYFVMYGEYCKSHSVTPKERTELTHPRRWPVTFDDLTRQWVEANAKPLALIVEASKRPRFFIPFYAGHRTETMIEIMLKHLVLTGDANRALQTRALIRLAADDVSGFREDVLAAHRIARLMAQGPTMIERVTADNMETSACEAERVGLSSGKLSGDQTRAMAIELAAIGDQPSFAESLNFGERYFALDTLQVLARKSPARAGELFNNITGRPDWRFGPPALYRFVPVPYEESMRKVNRLEDSALAALLEPSYPRRVAALKLLEQQTPGKDPGSCSVWDLTGSDWPAQLFEPALLHALSREESTRMETGLTKLALMLAAFKADRGSYPASLAELSPAYLATVPLDLFTEKPLIYSRTEKGYVLYSVGPNGVDDGGTGDDLMASLP
jgi:hypothetical protein